MAPPVAGAQQYARLGSELDEYLRYLELAGLLKRTPLGYRSPSSLSLVLSTSGTSAPWNDRYPLLAPDDTRGPRITLLDTDLRSVFNSRYPRHGNDAQLWAGRGFSADAYAGIRVTWGPLTAVLDPAVSFAQNRSFDQAPDSARGVNRGGLSSFAYPWQQGSIDWPERFGDAAFTTVDWGQSGLRADLRAFTVAVSTENMWWGPAARNPILMSNSAPGFPHLDLGTGRPAWIGAGQAEIRVIWGRLSESPYFDTIPDNDTRLFAGLVIGFRPRWIPGLTLGVGRSFYQTWDSIGLEDAFAIFQTPFKAGVADSANPTGNDRRDQLLAFNARWTLPVAGFEAYVEWARNDHNWDLRNFLIEPDHSRAYTIGFQQLLPGPGGRVRLRGEWTTLGRPATVLVRATPTYYVHHIARQGYTHRGQLLGASIGPGSQSQWLALDRFDHRGRVGAFVQRIRFDDDMYWTYYITNAVGGNRRHQTELTTGLGALRFFGPLDISATVVLSRELNRHYFEDADVTNLAFDLRARIRAPR